MSVEDQLADISNDLRAGREPQPVTVREFLSWFHAQRRGWFIVATIRRYLKDAGLITDPDFESAYIDSLIRFRLAPELQASALAPEGTASEHREAEGGSISAEPTYRISKLAAANTRPLSVAPTAELKEAVTLMMANDFSQLPVMVGERDVKGMVSWKSIGSRLALGTNNTRVSGFMDPHHEVRSDESIFRAIAFIVENDYVLVRGADNRIMGIVTASDLSLQFQNLSEPFLLIGEVENQIRQLLRDGFSVEELVEMRDSSDAGRKITSVSDLTFGEYVRAFENPQHWARIGLRIDRVTFCKYLDEVRRIRNDVMHFDPDGVPPDDLKRLRDFATFIHRIRAISTRIEERA